MVTAYPTSSEARKHFSDILDGAATGLPVTVRRGKDRFAVNDAKRLRGFLTKATHPGLRLGQEDGVWVASMDDRPFVAEGVTPDEAIDALVEELREYAEEWSTHYAAAPNHQGEWGLVQLIALSSDGQLSDWLRQEAP